MIRGNAVPTTVRFSEVRNVTVRIPPKASSFSRRGISTTTVLLHGFGLCRRLPGEEVHEVAQRPVGLADALVAYVGVGPSQRSRDHDAGLPADLASALGEAQHRLAAVLWVVGAGQQAHLDQGVEHPAGARRRQGRELRDPHGARLASLYEPEAEELPRGDAEALLQGRVDDALEGSRQEADVLGYQ